MTKTLLMFSGSFCAPCKKAKVVVDQIVDRVHCDFKYYVTDKMDCDDLVSQYGVQYLPTFIVIDNGEHKKFIGGNCLEDLEKALV